MDARYKFCFPMKVMKLQRVCSLPNLLLLRIFCIDANTRRFPVCLMMNAQYFTLRLQISSYNKRGKRKYKDIEISFQEKLKTSMLQRENIHRK